MAAGTETISMAAILSGPEAYHRDHGSAIRTMRLEARLSVPEAAAVLGVPVEELEGLEVGVRRYSTRAQWWAAMSALWAARRCAVDDCLDKVKAREKCDGHLKQAERAGATRPKRPYRTQKVAPK